MNAKAKAKKNAARLVALLLVAMMVIGMLAVTTDTSGNTGYDFGSHLTSDGFFKDVTAQDIVTLPAYEKYEMPKSLTEVSDDIVLGAIQSNALTSFATEEKDTSADRAAVLGDKVNLNYKGTMDGVEFEGGAADNYDLTLGSGAFIPGFEDAVVGHKVGENFDINVTFPEDYVDPETDAERAEQFNGKAAVFNITINHMYTTVYPELTDEFVKENFADLYASADEMTEYYRELLIDQQMKYYTEALLYSETEMTGDAPETVVTFAKELMKANMDAQYAQFGMTLEDVLGISGMTLEDFYTQQGLDNYVKTYLMTQAYYEKEGVVMTDDELKAYFEELYGTDDYSAIVTYYGKPYLKLSLMGEKMLDTIIENMPVVEKLSTENTETAE